MATPTDITDLSTTAASNSPAGSEAPSVLDNEIRALASIIKQEASSGSNIASGGTITPPAAGRFFHVTGTTTITTISSANSWNGRLIVLEFDGALTLTHHATNLALPGGANITTADGDIAVMVQESSGAWHCVSYLDASSHYIGPATTDTLTNKTIDADNNTISNIVIGAECTGASTALTDTADLTYNADTDVSSNGWVVDEDDMVSNLATKVPTQQSVKAYIDALSMPTGYTSSEQTITSGGTLSLTHGLGSAPRLVQVKLICKTTEDNYSVDDVIMIGSFGYDGGSVLRGVGITVDATTIHCRFGTATDCFVVPDKNTGVGVGLTNSNWKMVVEAWA